MLPVLNRGAVERAIRFGLAVGGTINRRSVFARKNYFYPDLPKGYQISQYEIPVVRGGTRDLRDERRREDRAPDARAPRGGRRQVAARGLPTASGLTGIDLNRAGTPLLEIVSEPDMRSAAEAVAYAKALHALVTGSASATATCRKAASAATPTCRCAAPANRSARAARSRTSTASASLQQAIEFEVRRQIELIEDGGTVVQETRLYDPDRDETRSMRSKEDAQDYRYFPDPDLPPLVIDDAWIERVRAAMPELPSRDARTARQRTGSAPTTPRS